MTDIASRLIELGIALPEPAAPVAAYVPTVLAGNLLHISGQVSFEGGQLMTGRELVHDAASDVGRASGDDDTGVGQSQVHLSSSPWHGATSDPRRLLQALGLV